MSTNKRGWVGKLLAAVLVTAAASVAHADIINVGTGDYTGSRTSTSGIDDNGWSGTLEVEWTISYDSQSGEFTYEYTVSGTNAPSISHFDIEVSEGFDFDDDVLDGSDDVDEGDRAWSNEGNDAPVLKFDFGTENDNGWEITYTLVTPKRPVWGDVLLKGGQELAYNDGFDTDPTATTTDFTDWVPTPDTVNMVPLPPAAWMGLGLLGVLGLARRRRQRRDI